jgi:hypothetical protein
MTMTDNRYIPTWERKYDRWETEPDTTLDFSDEEETEEEIAIVNDLEISLSELEELELADMELDNDLE